ncbi:molybdopterin dehydrogenase [Candidatus Acidianus copahuensis]|uniref:Molybdopterin dehydrogenase n=1 Tax=Candidatus Acidianus copahuensis TaxID=1160895 RepID=A0A031LJF7_9CREN|nr:xanthine dehydrogenase family protein subunit M [Candidatus Acidianus copahuensis]EZQ01691.1 molybdopterin dehydrogenase [Candidatus Acidianus copahuensis]
MYPAQFNYFAPKSVDETLELLDKFRDDAKILAGGQSLIILMKLRLFSPKNIIDINKIPGLSYIKEEEGYLKIGALTRYSDLEYSDLIKSRYPLLYESIKHLADPIVRNVGTVGGNVCHNDPGNNLPSVMLAYNAEFLVKSISKQRVIKAIDFFIGPYQTALQSNEMVVEIRIPVQEPKNSGAYMKLERRAGDFAIVASAVNVSIDDNGYLKKVGIALGAVGSTAIKADKAEEFLIGKKADKEVIKKASEIASEQTNPSSTPFGPSAEYKKAMAKVLTFRAFKNALRKVGVEI